MSNPLHAQENGEFNVDTLVAATGGDNQNRKSEYSGHHSFSIGIVKPKLYIYSYNFRDLIMKRSIYTILQSILFRIYLLTFSFIKLKMTAISCVYQAQLHLQKCLICGQKILLACIVNMQVVPHSLIHSLSLALFYLHSVY